jgi:alkyldihydroxyacetonephosphate synthase
VADLADELSTSLGARVSKAETDRVMYARDLWLRHHIDVRAGDIAQHKPAAIVWPRSTEEVAAIVARCAEEGTPLVPFGAGSGVCGGVLPDPRAIVLDLKRMSAVRSLRREVPSIDVEAGALGIRFEEDLQAQGLTLGHFPSSILCSTVGGWVAARSAGQCSGYYGKIEDMVVSLECVVGRGEIVQLKRRIAGPDLTPILTGSEGVLGVVTSAELRLHPKPTKLAFTSYAFPTTEAGWEAMREMFQAGLRPAVCRLYDAFDSFIARRGSVRGQRKGSSPGASASSLAKSTKDAALRLLLRAPSVMNRLIDAVGDRAFGGAMMVLVLEGDASRHPEDLARIRHVAARYEGRDLGEAPARRWYEHRYSVSYRLAPVFMAGAFSDTLEVAAPWSRLGELYREVRRAMGKHVFVMAHLSHAYPDGCSIYFTFAGSAPTREASLALYDSTWRDALEAAVRAGGTISHHHGVGRSKAPRLGSELGLGVEVVRSLMRVFDPAGIFNPGNLLPSVAPRRPAHDRPVPDVAKPRFDDSSLLVEAHGATSLKALEELAHSRGLTLRLPATEETVSSFLARGAPGAPDPWEDPVDHLVAGFTARLASGEQLVVHPGPRRAVGPDLYALFAGLSERVGVIESASLRLHRTGLAAHPLTCAVPRDPAIGAAERLLIEAVVKETKGARFQS